MIDTYFRIKSLADSGIRIHLHCFEYGRPHADELGKVCHSVSYYKRKRGIRYFFSLTPYIIITRNSAELLNNLSGDDFPVLFDGIHTTYFIGNPAIAGKRKLVRLHNIEHRYYLTQSKNERSVLKKIYLFLESLKLRSYESILKKADILLPISSADNAYFNLRYQKTEMILPFHQNNEVKINEGTGGYVLYHGDLSVAGNIKDTVYLIKNVFSKTIHDCIIAGKNPHKRLMRLAMRYRNIRVIPDPDSDEMEKLIRNSQIITIPTGYTNGFKIKLLNSLYIGRHCIVNNKMIQGTWLGMLCNIADRPNEMVDMLERLMDKPVTAEMVNRRKMVLQFFYNNQNNALILSGLIFPDSSPER